MNLVFRDFRHRDVSIDDRGTGGIRDLSADLRYGCDLRVDSG
jgi:hypothetical protein